MKTVAIVQARMTSTRLPGKVLAPLNGRPMLAYMLARLRRAGRLDGVVLATTVNATDDPVAALCADLGVTMFRGDEADVLGRYVAAAAQASADAVVRLTADCPLIDPAIVDAAVEQFGSEGCDYLSNAMERTFPDGLDVEVFTRAALGRADRDASLPFHREHVTPYMRAGLYEDIPTGPFKVGHMRAPADFSHLRWTVDTAEDLERVRAIAAAVPDDHGWMDVVSLLTRRTELLGPVEALRGMEAERSNISLRPAAAGDVDLLFAWVNQADSLAGKLLTNGPIPRADHVDWFEARLNDEDCGLWIAETDRVPVGQVRLERQGDALHVDIYVDPRHRGAGVGAAMLEAARNEAVRDWPGVPLLARVKADNWTSRRLFAKAGYGRMTVAPGYVVLHLDPLPASGIERKQ